MVLRSALLGVCMLGASFGCSTAAPAERSAARSDATPSTTIAGTDHLDAPDLGCVASLESRAIDDTGGSRDLDLAVAAERNLPDPTVVRVNERYAWVTSTAGDPPRRALFIDGGSGWALLRIDSCRPATGEPLTPLGL